MSERRLGTRVLLRPGPEQELLPGIAKIRKLAESRRQKTRNTSLLCSQKGYLNVVYVLCSQQQIGTVKSSERCDISFHFRRFWPSLSDTRQ